MEGDGHDAAHRPVNPLYRISRPFADTVPMQIGASARLAAAAAVRGAAAGTPFSRALSSARVSARLGYFCDRWFMLVS